MRRKASRAHEHGAYCTFLGKCPLPSNLCPPSILLRSRWIWKSGAPTISYIGKRPVKTCKILKHSRLDPTQTNVKFNVRRTEHMFPFSSKTTYHATENISVIRDRGGVALNSSLDQSRILVGLSSQISRSRVKLYSCPPRDSSRRRNMHPLRGLKIIKVS